jgi:cell division protein FtsX
VISATVILSTRGDDKATAVTTFASAGVDCAPSPDATGQVFLRLTATDDQINAVRSAIEAVPGVTIVRYLDPQAAYTQFVCIFADNPDLMNAIQPQDLPAAFAIKTGALDSVTLDRLRAIRGTHVETPTSWPAWVDEQRQEMRDSVNESKNADTKIIGSSSTFDQAGVECAPSPDATVQVFVSPRKTQDQIDAVRAAIAAIPGITIDQYLDPEAAQAQFACVFDDNPDVLNSTQSGGLSVSFSVKTGGLDADTLSRLRGVPNVLGVETPASWSTSIDDPNSIWHMMLRT